MSVSKHVEILSSLKVIISAFSRKFFHRCAAVFVRCIGVMQWNIILNLWPLFSKSLFWIG